MTTSSTWDLTPECLGFAFGFGFGFGFWIVLVYILESSESGGSDWSNLGVITKRPVTLLHFDFFAPLGTRRPTPEYTTTTAKHKPQQPILT
jgi:hypothetical protein